MTDKRDRPTVPSMPVPSRNPVAELRKKLDRSKVAILREEGGVWRGITIGDGFAERHTCVMWEQEAKEWLVEAHLAVEEGRPVPTICPRCSKVRHSSGQCENCFSKRNEK